MDEMFYSADSFNRVLCGDSWIESSASMFAMFIYSGGSIGACSSSDDLSGDGLSGDGLSGGAVAGIVIGVLPGLGLCIGAAAYMALKLKRRTSTLTEPLLTEAELTEAELTEAVFAEAFAEAVKAEAVVAEEV